MRLAIRMVGFAVPVAAVASLITAQVLGQPRIQADDPKTPKFTAFPDVKMPRKEEIRVKVKVSAPDFDRLLARLSAGHPRPIPADAPPLVKVRTAQVNEGVLFLTRIQIWFGIGHRYQADQIQEVAHHAAEVYRVAAELEPAAAEKLGYYEDCLRFLKFLEEFTIHRVLAGHDPPHQLNMVAFYRLQAEADLIQLKESVKGEK